MVNYRSIFVTLTPGVNVLNLFSPPSMLRQSKLECLSFPGIFKFGRKFYIGLNHAAFKAQINNQGSLNQHLHHPLYQPRASL